MFERAGAQARDRILAISGTLYKEFAAGDGHEAGLCEERILAAPAGGVSLTLKRRRPDPDRRGTGGV